MAAAMLAAAVVSCSSGKEDPATPQKPDDPDGPAVVEPTEYAFAADPASLAFPGEGGTKTFQLTTEAAWVADCQEDWVSFGHMSGQGDDEIFVSVPANPDTEYARRATIVFEVDGEGTGSLEVEIRQEPGSGETPGPGPEMSVRVTTQQASDVKISSARLGGFYSEATADVREVGFEWGMSASTLDETLQAQVPGTDDNGSFSATLDGLGEKKTYYFRAYVILQSGNDIKTFYGSVLSFTTSASDGPATGSQPGWFELPAMDIAREGEYMVSATDNSLYYAWHISPDVYGPGGKLARNYTVCFSAEHHCPMWVAAPRHTMYTGSSGRNDSYRADPDIPADIQYSSKSTGGGCNKGHMLGSAERTCSKETNRQVFYYSNIAPQLSSGFNTGGGGWNLLEDYVDTQVCRDTLYEVVGCYFDKYTDGYGQTQTPSTISFGSRNDVSMPTMFYYVLLRTRSGSSGKSVRDCSASELQCVAFVRAHVNTLKGQKPSAAELMSVSDLEKITGFTYFENVPNAPKSTYNASDWGL